jgi:hypothetical protein
MSNSESPSSRWSREHGNKRIYTDPLTADQSAIRLTKDRSDYSDTRWEAYECRWGQRYEAGPTAETHWHIGRPGRRHREA